MSGRRFYPAGIVGVGLGCAGDDLGAGLLGGGEGSGTSIGLTVRVGGGNGASLLLFELFEFTLDGGDAVTSSSGVIVGLALTFLFMFAFAELMLLDGMFDSADPVGGDVACTGWLFGSAASPG